MNKNIDETIAVTSGDCSSVDKGQTVVCHEQSDAELWDIYDKDRCKVGRTHMRGDRLAVGEYHIVVHCCIFNSQGEMLIQQRQSFKHGWPNMWDITVGGSALGGESGQQAIQRELFEEISVQYDFSNMRPQMTVNFDGGFNDVFIIVQDIDIAQLQLQYEEVQAVRWASHSEIFGMLDEGTFVTYHKSFIDMLFDMRYRYGSGRM